MVSIIMPAYNAESTIFESIKSVLNQTYQDWELIIINDGSIDKTESIVKNIFDKRISYYYQTNSGVSAARNFGLTVCKGDYIAFLDSDDCWDKIKLFEQLEFFENNPNYSMIHTDYYTFDKTLDALKYKKYIEPYNNICSYYDKLLINDIIVTSSVMLKREVYQSIKFFDNQFFGVEDWDYWIRVAKEFNIAYINVCLTYYRENISGISKNLKRQLAQEHLLRNKHLTLNVSKRIRNLSHWQLLKKELFFVYKTKNPIIAIIYYFKMMILYPFKKDTYLLPYNLFKNVFTIE